MRALLAVGALAALLAVGAVVAAIVLGHRTAEPTVVADPYEAGLHYDEAHHQHDAAAVGPRAAPRCDPARAPCAQRVAGATVALAVAPAPVLMKDLAFTVEVTPPAAAGAGAGRLALSMPGMYMGEHPVALAADGPGRWRGTGVLVRCPSGRRGWAADVEVPSAGGAPLRATFTFEAAER
ncbi:FixH family protein [Anaeromyxobacter diazotrophicus]|uniref:FixH family protein n=1 Tax=Anaeromyxobacter diazotrophicus TaxID=2590199 RepID=UPI0015907F85|nr:FixH family protein [Anaeromyxobacter diazotrophicus]